MPPASQQCHAAPRARPISGKRPETLAEQAKALRTALASQPRPVTATELAKGFARTKLDRVEELLETLVSLGQARITAKGTYTS